MAEPDPRVVQLLNMLDKQDRVDRQDKKATALMTAESILIAFLVAYAPVFNTTIRSLDPKHLFGTVLAGLLVYALALTAFRSILLLYKSIGTGNPKDGNYLAGYELFLMIIVGSSVYVQMNAVSIVHYGVVHHVVFFPNEPVSIIVAAIFFAGWVLLLVLRAPELATYVRCVRRKLGNWHFGALAVLVSLDVIIVGIMLQYRPLWQWPLYFDPIAAFVATILAFCITGVRWNRLGTK